MAPESAAIHVSTDALTSFASHVQRAAESSIAPCTGQLLSTFEAGVEFGAGNPSADLGAMIAKYGDCLDAVNEQLIAYMAATTILVDAAVRIATTYRASDSHAAVTATAVSDVLVEATAAAYTPTPGRVPDRPAL